MRIAFKNRSVVIVNVDYKLDEGYTIALPERGENTGFGRGTASLAVKVSVPGTPLPAAAWSGLALMPVMAAVQMYAARV